ncbi:MAG: hypothetical protein PWP46_1203 [Fusobacteriaceae bacterium]|jgi:hypothetical protein|nr:hypothetical protein [Fusobacteriales bacterium]MDN5304319.1 hypothetical protein [Fusobacteriaceae bacterium]
MKKIMIILVFSFFIVSCNLFESLDNNRDTDEIKAYETEQALESGDYSQAISLAEETINSDSDMQSTDTQSDAVVSKVSYSVTAISSITVSSVTVNDIDSLTTEEISEAISTTTDSSVAIAGAEKVYDDIVTPLSNLINQNTDKAKEYTEAKATIAEGNMGQGNLKTTSVIDKFTDTSSSSSINIDSALTYNSDSTDNFSITDLINVNHNYKKEYLKKALEEFMKALAKDRTQFDTMESLVENYVDKYTAEMVTSGVWLAIIFTDIFADNTQSQTDWIFKNFASLTDDDKADWMAIKPYVVLVLTNIKEKLVMLLGVTEDSNGGLVSNPSGVVNIKLLEDNYSDFFDVVSEFDTILDKVIALTFTSDNTGETAYTDLLNELTHQ